MAHSQFNLSSVRRVERKAAEAALLVLEQMYAYYDYDALPLEAERGLKRAA